MPRFVRLLVTCSGAGVASTRNLLAQISGRRIAIWKPVGLQCLTTSII